MVYSFPPLGSSPHAWGPPPGDTSQTNVERIIPTRVGTTPMQRSSRRTPEDHPHTRGDHSTSISASGSGGGSSPHAWGPHRPRDGHAAVLRIIPTRVGTTPPWPGPRRPGGDHPHTRGDHPGGAKTMVPDEGSSPHAWGPRPCRSRRTATTGIIPTRVGTTPTATRSGCAWRDHPHTRGDHNADDTAAFSKAGSSPHAWGPPVVGRRSDFERGIIPTRVGTTLPCRRSH